MFFRYFLINCPLKKACMALHMNNLNPHFPSLIEIGKIVLENKKKMKKVYGQINDMPSEKLIWAFSTSEVKKGTITRGPWKERGPSYEQLETPLHKDALCQVWLKLPKMVPGKFTDRRTDKWRAIGKAHLCFQHRWAKTDTITRGPWSHHSSGKQTQ